ncbi:MULTISPECIES: alpha/beta hydrolase [unclassified Janibacter]|uniref:alpha/beta hydrolase n=1 Tax=unclassified Janibacter TaxID=2649294 RepID=UPI003D01E771
MTDEDEFLGRASAEPDQVIAYGEDPEQVMDLWIGARTLDTAGTDSYEGVPEEPPGRAGRPVVVLLHGGFWRGAYDRTHLRPTAGALRDLGWMVVVPEYRRRPGSPDVTTGDVTLALRHINDGALDGAGIAERGFVVVGHSAGGHLALWALMHLNLDHRVGTLTLAAVADLRRAHLGDLGGGAVAAFVGGDPESRPDLDPARATPRPDGGLTLVHGVSDLVVPIGVNEDFVRTATTARLVALPHVGHFDLVDPLSEAWPDIVSEIERFAR